MLENIAVSVSTVIFLLCSFIISSVLPDKGDAGSPPSEPLRGESVGMTESVSATESVYTNESVSATESVYTNESVSATESVGTTDSIDMTESVYTNDSVYKTDSVDIITGGALPAANLTDEFSIEGIWECFGHRYAFKSAGRLIAEGETLRWQLSNGEMVINYDGKPHIVTFEPLGERVMRLDGKTFYRISGS